MEEVQSYLNKAADLIEQKGWGQGTPLVQGKECIGTAIWEVCIFSELEEACYKEVARRLGITQRFALVTRVILWNDEPDRTKEEVVEVLRKAGR